MPSTQFKMMHLLSKVQIGRGGDAVISNAHPARSQIDAEGITMQGERPFFLPREVVVASSVDIH